MIPEEFVNALAMGGSTNMSDDVQDAEFCPVHGYEGDLYHEDECPVYAAKLERLIR